MVYGPRHAASKKLTIRSCRNRMPGPRYYGAGTNRVATRSFDNRSTLLPQSKQVEIVRLQSSFYIGFFLVVVSSNPTRWHHTYHYSTASIFIGAACIHTTLPLQLQRPSWMSRKHKSITSVHKMEGSKWSSIQAYYGGSVTTSDWKASRGDGDPMYFFSEKLFPDIQRVR